MPRKPSKSLVKWWVGQFQQLDQVLPTWKKGNVWGFNKVRDHYRAVGMRDPGTPAYWYNEYREGFNTIEEAATHVAQELPGWKGA